MLVNKKFKPGAVNPSFLRRCQSFRGAIRIMNLDETSTSGKDEGYDYDAVEYPIIPPERGPKYFFISPTFNLLLKRDKNSFASQFCIADPYLVVRPQTFQTVYSPPEGCVAVYKGSLELGLRFPLHSFIETILREYNLTITSLVPNSWGNIISFIAVCSMLGVAPTLRLWRNLVKLVESRSDDHGKGWYSFQCRMGYRVVQGLSSNQSGFRRTFFVFRGDSWPFPSSVDGEPNFGLNLNVPPMSIDEGLVAIYFQLRSEWAQGQNKYYPKNWLPSPTELRNEEFLSAMGLSQAYDQVVARSQLCSEMASRLNAAAIRAAAIRQQIKAAEVKIPDAPQNPKHKKRLRPSTSLKVGKFIEDNPFDESPKEKRRKKKSTLGVEVVLAQAAHSVAVDEKTVVVSRVDKEVDEEDFIDLKNTITEDIPPESSRGPAGSARPFTMLNPEDRNQRVAEAIRAVYSKEDETYLGKQGIEQINDLHDSWLDMTIRMHAVSTFFVRAVKEKAALEEKEEAHRLTQEHLDAANAQLEIVKFELEAANANLANTRAELDLAKEAREVALMEKEDLTTSLNLAKESLISTQEGLRQVEALRKAAEEACDADIKQIVNKWLATEAGDTFKFNLRVDGAAEGVKIIEADILDKMKAVVEQRQPDLWAALESDYRALVEKEKENEANATGVEEAKAGGSDLSSSSSTSDDDDDDEPKTSSQDKNHENA